MDEVDEAGVVGGQGKTAEDVKNAASLKWVLVLVLLFGALGALDYLAKHWHP